MDRVLAYPLWWSRRGGAEVQPAREFHERKLEGAGDGRPRLPRPPEGLVVFPVSRKPLRKGSRRSDDPRLAALREQGVPVSWGEVYPLSKDKAQEALLALHHVVRSAGGAGRLEWAAGRYYALRRPEKGRSARTSSLAELCFLAVQRPEVQSEVVAFVSDYGELVRDFGLWCGATEERGLAVAGPAAGLHPLRSRLGNERFLWPDAWRRWATKAASAQPSFMAHRVPPPVAFYVWAALMLAAVHDHPEWPGSQLFVANRLASLRLVLDEGEEGKPTVAGPVGELLDYLGSAAAFGVFRMATCVNCSQPFPWRDRKRRYCDACSTRKIRGAVQQRRFRDKKRQEREEARSRG